MEAPWDAQSEHHLRRALARDAYRRSEIRLANASIAGAECLVASRRGLFAANRSATWPVLWGYFFGIARHGDTIYVFEAGDRPAAPGAPGRIVRLNLDGARLGGACVIAEGLHGQIHQIRMIDGLLWLVDTADQAIVRLRPDGTPVDALRPLADGVYHHINAIADVGEHVALLLHNGPVRPERDSEIALLSRDGRLVHVYPIAGQNCHDILPLAGEWWHCASLTGEIISSSGRRIAVSEQMTRGLAATADGMIVGTSLFGPRSNRENLPGSLIWLDRDGQAIARVDCPGGPTDLLWLGEGG